MRWSRNLKLSIRAIGRSWTRTALSTSGVAVGIAAVVVLAGAGRGAEAALGDALRQMGRNLLVVSAGRSETGALRGASRMARTLTMEDGRVLAREVPGVVRAAPLVELETLARVGGRAVGIRVAGTTPPFGKARHFEVAAGRFIDDEDVRGKARVAVVGPVVVRALFGGESPLGEILSIRGVPFRIVGVTKNKGVSFDGSNEDELVIIPVTTAMRRLMDVAFLNRVVVQAGSEAALPEVSRKIAAVLRGRHGIRPGAPDDFGIADQTALLRAQREAGGPLGRLVAGLSMLALALGGVGLMAVSLLSIRERHPEIGLRVAVGGRPRDIAAQFLTESLLVSALGGAVGLTTGLVGIAAGARLTRWPMVVGWEALVYPTAISVALALVFGSYPALKAARLDPIQALSGR